MLKPSKKHFLRYDAQTYEKEGFIQVSGKVRELAPIVNEKIHEDEDYLPDCISVLVCARVMTEAEL